MSAYYIPLFFLFKGEHMRKWLKKKIIDILSIPARIKYSLYCFWFYKFKCNKKKCKYFWREECRKDPPDCKWMKTALKLANDYEKIINPKVEEIERKQISKKIN